MMQHYEIRIKGHLDLSWSDWLDGLKISHQENGETLLTGLVVDQAALHGLLNKMRDLGITLVSVNPLPEVAESRQENADEPNI